METGFITKCTEMVYLLGLMDENTRGNILMIKKKAMEFLHGQMKENMMVYG